MKPTNHDSRFNSYQRHEFQMHYILRTIYRATYFIFSKINQTIMEQIQFACVSCTNLAQARGPRSGENVLLLRRELAQ